MINKGDRVLCFAPHPDDIELGLGGTLHKYANQDIQFLGIVFSDRSKSRGELFNKRDQSVAIAKLGYPNNSVFFIDELDYLETNKLMPMRMFGHEKCRDKIRMILTKVVNKFNPNIIFVPGLKETNQDHQAIAEESVRILRGNYHIYGYEVLKHNRFFSPTLFVNLNESDLNAKIEAVNSFTEFTNRYYFDEKLIKSLSIVRSIDAGYSGFAEAFEAYRIYHN